VTYSSSRTKSRIEVIGRIQTLWLW